MVDGSGVARSSFFKVKDEDAFKQFCGAWGCEPLSSEYHFVSQHCIDCINNVPDNQCDDYPRRIVGECKGRRIHEHLVGFVGTSLSDRVLDDFLRDLTSLIAHDWVAVIESGITPTRREPSVAIAVNANREIQRMSPDLIYAHVHLLGRHHTRTDYRDHRSA